MPYHSTGIPFNMTFRMLQNTSSEGTVKTTDSSKLNDDCMTGTPIISKLFLGITRSRTKKLFEQKRYIQQACTARGVY